MSRHNHGARISMDYTYKGMRLLVVENEKIKVSVLLDKGTDIIEFIHKPTDTDFMWRSPLDWHSSQHFLPTTYDSRTSFMDYFGGGWQECFPNGGRPSKYGKTEIGQHGEVCTLPWECAIVKDSPEEVEAVCTVRTFRTPFLVKKTFTLKRGEGILKIKEEITNEGEENLPYMWGQHPALGENILDDSCRIDVPAKKVMTHSRVQDSASGQFPPSAAGDWPFLKNIRGEIVDNSKVPSRTQKTHDLLFLSELKEGWFALTNTNKRLGIGMSWDIKLFPYVWLWQVYGGATGYPWYGRTYNIALEPWTSWLNDGIEASLKNGTARELKSKETVATSFAVSVYEGKDEVKSIDRDGKVS